MARSLLWYMQLAGNGSLSTPFLEITPRRFHSSTKPSPGSIPAGEQHAGYRPADHFARSLRSPDYATITALLPKVKRVVTPLGGIAPALLGNEAGDY